MNSISSSFSSICVDQDWLDLAKHVWENSGVEWKDKFKKNMFGCLIGKIFGYPECCILEFESGVSAAFRQGKHDLLGTGYVPCTTCLEKINKIGGDKWVRDYIQPQRLISYPFPNAPRGHVLENLGNDFTQQQKSDFYVFGKILLAWSVLGHVDQEDFLIWMRAKWGETISAPRIEFLTLFNALLMEDLAKRGQINETYPVLRWMFLNDSEEKIKEWQQSVAKEAVLLRKDGVLPKINEKNNDINMDDVDIEWMMYKENHVSLFLSLSISQSMFYASLKDPGHILQYESFLPDAVLSLQELISAYPIVRKNKL